MAAPAIECFRQLGSVLCCPRCGGSLELDAEQRFVCAAGSHRYPPQDEVPSVFVPNEWEQSRTDVTDAIKAFYEAHPFPDYEACDDTASLIERARSGVVAKLLDDSIPYGARVLECGCGTGQLTNFLSIAKRTVVGTDLSVASLKKALVFKQQNSLNRAHFLQMNLFRPAFKPGSFDLVIANGVLHHTSDPFRGFQSISPLVRPGGHILIGLYHRYGRLATDLRRVLFKFTNRRLKWLDRRAVDAAVGSHKRATWFEDQYMNPHESKHTVTEVVGWFERTGFAFVNALPKAVPFAETREDENVFAPTRFGGALERLLVNARMAVTGHRDGGFFIVVGVRQKAGETPALR
jgi:SAM-dependent methyltransferase